MDHIGCLHHQCERLEMANCIALAMSTTRLPNLHLAKFVFYTMRRMVPLPLHQSTSAWNELNSRKLRSVNDYVQVPFFLSSCWRSIACASVL